MATSIQATGCNVFGDFEVGEAISQYKWTGSAMTSDWNTRGNWSGGVPTALFNVLIPSAISGGKVYPQLNSGSGTVKNLTIGTSATLTLKGTKLQIAGNIINSGTFDASKGTIEMNGSSAQSIAGSMFYKKTIQNLIVSNTGSGLSVASTANDTLKITGTLSFGNSSSTLNTGGNLTLVSDSLGTASVGKLAAGNSTNGQATVERYINKYRNCWSPAW